MAAPLRGDGGVEAVEGKAENDGGGEADDGGREAQPSVHAQDRLRVHLQYKRASPIPSAHLLRAHVSPRGW